MKMYIGTKLVKMKPMNRKEYNDFRGWELPSEEDGADEGYLVEYMDGGKPNVEGHEGYVSWSPKEQAGNAYRETSGLPFSLALEATKKGRWYCAALQRYLSRSSPFEISSAHSKMTGSYLYIDTSGLQTNNEAAPKCRVPWAPSQTDMMVRS